MFVLGVLLSLLAKGFAAFNGAFSVDDVIFVSTPFTGDAVSSVAHRDGRLLYPALINVIYGLGVDAQKSFGLSVLVYIVCTVLTAQLINRIWHIDQNFYASLCSVLFITLHPYQSDFLSWKVGILTAGIPIVLAMYGLWLAGRSLWHALIASVIIAVTMAIHQIGFSWLVVTLCFSGVLETLRFRGGRSLQHMDQALLRRGGAVVSGVGLYLLILFLFSLSEGSDTQARLYRFDTGTFIAQTPKVLHLILYENPFYAPLLSGILAFLFLSCWLIAIRVISETEQCAWYGFMRLLFLCGLFLISIIACLAFPVLTFAKGQLFLRTMSALGVMWAGISVVSILFTQSAVFRPIFFFMLSLVFFGFVGMSNQVLSEQARANHRDIELARNILSHLQELDGYSHIDKLAVIGSRPTSLKGLRFALDLSEGEQQRVGVVMSIFANRYGNIYRVSLMNEFLGTALLGDLIEGDVNEAEAYCQYSNRVNGRFPAIGSYVRRGTLGIVCL